MTHAAAFDTMRRTGGLPCRFHVRTVPVHTQLTQADRPMKFDEYVQHDGLALADLVRRGEVSATELLDAATARADATHASLNAIVKRLDDAARRRVAEGFGPGLPFGGVPFLVKDLFQDIAGEPNGSGSRSLKRVPAPEDADVVRRWREAGLVIFGKTNSPEFGARNVTEPHAFGVTRNPWDLGRTPGGSSGGSASAVAAGVVPVAGANDGGGSIRIPAAACGLFGIKAGRGRISMGPMFGEGMNGAAVQGVVSRSVRDSAAMLDILQGPEPHAPYFMPAPATPYLDALKAPVRKLRIGFSWASPLGTEVHPEARAAVERAATLLRSLGHEVDEASPAIDGVQMAQDFLLSWFAIQAGLVDDIMAHTGARPSDFEPDTRAMAAVGRSVGASELLRSQARWHEHVRALSRFHARYDCWMSPVLSAPPVRIGALDTPKALHLLNELISGLRLSGWLRSTPAFQKAVIQNLAWTPYTQLGNLTGRPAMSVPLHWTPEGLPMGVQFVGALDSEALLLQLATQLEQAQPWFDRRPPL